MPQTFRVQLDRVAQHVDVPPGGEIILKGSFTSKHDGSVVDASTTTWPQGAPGGASVDSGGLLEFAGGGFHVTSRDPVTHEVHAVATGEAAPACEAFGAQAPCLVLRLRPQAQSRLMTDADWSQSLVGGISVEVPAAPLVAVAPSTVPYIQGAIALLGVGAIACLGWVVQRRRASSPAGQLRAMVRRIRSKLQTADPVVAAPLAPALDAAIAALERKRIDAASAEGKRVTEVLRRVEIRIDQSVEKARADEEQQAADELVREMESAIEAADEVAGAERRA